MRRRAMGGPSAAAVVWLIVFACGVGCGSRTGIGVDDPAVDASPCRPVGAETCNGTDDDCDGFVDEDVSPRVCGDTPCVQMLQCEDGAFPECVPRVPTAEVCNGIDDDCDGVVDEDLAFGALGEAITVRTDEFDTGDCTSCLWAFGNTLAPTDDGFVALFNLGLSGGSERPNLYRRFLDRRGRPTGPVELALDDFILWMFPLAGVEPMPPGGVPNATYYRIGSDDVFGLLLTPPTGRPTAVQPLSPHGSRNVELMVWSGQRYVAAWTEADGLTVATFAPDGSDERRVPVDAFGSHIGSITLGVWQGRVGILVSGWDDPMDRFQWFYLLDAEGTVLVQRRIDLEYASWQRLVGVEEGWVYISPGRFRAPSTTQLVSPTFEPLSELAPFPDGRSYGDSGSGDFFLPRPALHQTVAVWGATGLPDDDMHVEVWGPRGEVQKAWSGPLPVEADPDQAYIGHPHVSADGDGVLVMWNAGAPNSTPNRVYVREFGCLPL
ncbi:MAG: putative metal-binding motif-containing protein [Deltaproteobacteria bacterium]|nr:putative metal-binding motif-containing protein [Deltaproteobacteria bacterium]